MVMAGDEAVNLLDVVLGWRLNHIHQNKVASKSMFHPVIAITILQSSVIDISSKKDISDTKDPSK